MKYELPTEIYLRCNALHSSSVSQDHMSSNSRMNVLAYVELPLIPNTQILARTLGCL